MFQVCLTIKIFSFDVAQTIYSFSREAKQIGREESVLYHSHNLADLDVAPLSAEWLPVLIKHLAVIVVLLIVLLVPEIVFVSVFDHRHKDHEAEWREHCRLPIAD